MSSARRSQEPGHPGHRRTRPGRASEWRGSRPHHEQQATDSLISGIMIGVQREETQEVAITICHGANSPRHTQAVEPPTSGARTRKNRSPTQAALPVKLVTFQLPKLFQSRENRQRIFAFQGKPGFLKDRVVQVQYDAGHERRATGVWSPCAPAE